MSDRPQISPDDAGLVAEYAMGLLDAAEARAVEVRLSAEPGLRAELVFWQAQLARMAEDEVDAVMPPARLKAALQARLFAPAADAGPVPFWQRLGLWRAMSLATSVGVVALAAMLLFVDRQDGPAPGGPRFVAQLAGEDATLQLAALFDAGSGVLEVTRAAGDVPAGRAQELWLIAGEAAPVSLGLLGEDGRLAVLLPADLAQVMPGALLAVSDEPAGGSPTGQPTGAVLAAGALTQL